MNNILKYKTCFGCGICSITCPKKIINIKENKNGFLEPYITVEKSCINCGLCLKVCPLNNKIEYQEAKKGYATWSKDEDSKQKSSSGGTIFEISKTLIEKGYNFIGVKYYNNKAEHYCAENVLELLESRGSKYIQSDFTKGIQFLKKYKKYVVIGTPCQIAGLRNFIKLKNIENDFVLIDFFCHGVPSYLMWNKYIDQIGLGGKKIIKASWRNKQYGWHDSYCMDIETEDGVKYSKRRGQGDLFYKFFFSNVCLNKSCYLHCKFKAENSSADIRAGDLWGPSFKDNDLGITGILAFSEKGDKIINCSNLEIKNIEKDIVKEGQMKKNEKLPYFYNFLFYLLRSRLSLKYIYKITQLLRLKKIIKYKLR